MKSIIIYYSYSGNTQSVAVTLAEYLKAKGEAAIIKLECWDEANSFFTQALRAFRRIKGKIKTANYDLSSYDLVCMGTPVWAFGPAPAINTYLEGCSGLKDKAAILFTTYGSGTGNKRCLNYMQDILRKKGALSFRRFSIQQFKVADKEFVLSKIKELFL